MKNFKEITTELEQLHSITCDCCKEEYLGKDTFELEEFLSLSQVCGYESVFGDGNTLELDLCQHCVKKLLEDYIRIRERS
jgi:hypothetical protein